MCGIVGYAGDKNADSVLLVGLIRLEYRGYDSAGIAVYDGNEVVVRKERGKIRELEKLLQAQPVDGSIGIGHTRWATHGEPGRKNAHPHIDSHGRIAVVHNGIIENHSNLARKLEDRGHVFRSETDSEVIPHLIEEAMSEGKSLSDAIQSSIHELDGRYAFVLIHELEPDRLYFARKGSPLVLGQGEGENFLASDISAVIPGAKMHYPIRDGEWGWITKTECVIFNEEGRTITPDFAQILVKEEELDKGEYPHFMLKEIYEQPAILRNLIDKRINGNGNKVLYNETELPRDFQSKIARIVITSAGTSWHSGLIARHYFERFARVSTEVDLSSEFRYRNPIAGGDTLLMAISQSGETADTLAGIYEAKARFLKVLSFVNNPHSTMARESDAIVELMAGPEIGVASTKAYTAQLLNLLFYSLHLGSLKWNLSPEEKLEIFEEIRQIPAKIETILQRADELKKWAMEMKSYRDFVFLGREFNFPTALEGALKLKEISYVHASGYAGGEFKHGPIALISPEVPVVAVVPNTVNRDKMISNIEEVRARSGIILSVHTEGDEDVKRISDFSFEIPSAPDYLTPLLTVIPLQLFSYYMALEKGCEPDQPRNLAKSVTVE